MITLHPDVIAELVVLLKGAGIEGQFLSKLEEYLFNLKSYGNAAIGIKGAPMEHLAGESPLCLMRFPFASFALLEITVHSYGGTHFLAPPQCICCYLSFAILPHISAAFSLVRRAGCTFSARSISLGWLIQFSRSFVRYSSL